MTRGPGPQGWCLEPERRARRRWSRVVTSAADPNRVSDQTAFFTVDVDDEKGMRTGELIEFDDTEVIFTQASDKRTEDYVTGRFG